MSIEVDILITGMMLLVPAEPCTLGADKCAAAQQNGDAYKKGALLVAPDGKKIDYGWTCSEVPEHHGVIRFAPGVAQADVGEEHLRATKDWRIWDLTNKHLAVEGIPECKPGRAVCSSLPNMPSITDVHKRTLVSSFELPDEIRADTMPNYVGMRVPVSGGRLRDNDWSRAQRWEQRRSWWHRLWFSPVRLDGFVDVPHETNFVPALPERSARRGTRGIRWRFRIPGDSLTLAGIGRDGTRENVQLRPLDGKRLELQLLFQPLAEIEGAYHAHRDIVGHAQLLYRLLGKGETLEDSTLPLLPQWVPTSNRTKLKDRGTSDTACPPFHGGP